MFTSKVYFQKIFSVGQFLNEHYGSEITLEPGDTVMDAYKRAIDDCNKQFEIVHPPAHQYRPLRQPDGELPVIQEKER